MVSANERSLQIDLDDFNFVKINSRTVPSHHLTHILHVMNALCVAYDLLTTVPSPHEHVQGC